MTADADNGVDPHKPATTPDLLIDLRGVAELFHCSTRHVERMADAGKMPAPLKLGRLKRWSRRAIQAWIDAGCPSCRRAGR